MLEASFATPHVGEPGAAQGIQGIPSVEVTIALGRPIRSGLFQKWLMAGLFRISAKAVERANRENLQDKRVARAYLQGGGNDFI